MQAVNVKIIATLVGMFVVTNTYSFYVLSKSNKIDYRSRK